MTINKRWNRARKQYQCVKCKDVIPVGHSYCRMFGMAERGDPPYAIRVCGLCADKPDLPEGCKE